VLTLFSIPKAFKGHIGIIQRNAIASWKRLHPQIEIILFGTDDGVAEVARELGALHEPNIARNEFGTYLLDSAFAQAQRIAANPVLCYVNCDIILLRDFFAAVEKTKSAVPEFLMIGQRTDVDIREPWPFDRATWNEELQEFATRYGKLRTPDWIDYFAFTKGLFGADIPAFAIGRTCWDNWLVWRTLASGKPVVNASAVVQAIHQNHDYNHHPQGTVGVWKGEEASRNAALAGGWKNLRHAGDATHVLTAQGLAPNGLRYWSSAKRTVESIGRYFVFDVWHPVWHAFLGATRPLRTAMGFRSRH
jgi:hypothetical protein